MRRQFTAHCIHRDHPFRNLEAATRSILDCHHPIGRSTGEKDRKLTTVQRMKRVADGNRPGMRTVGIVRQSATTRTPTYW